MCETDDQTSVAVNSTSTSMSEATDTISFKLPVLAGRFLLTLRVDSDTFLLDFDAGFLEGCSTRCAISSPSALSTPSSSTSFVNLAARLYLVRGM